MPLGPFWIPLHEAASLGAGQLQAVQAMGDELVLWRDSQGRPRLLRDRCPHRGARLSLGRVLGDTLQCGYHGWCFGAAGACERIPALPGFTPPANLAATAFDVHEAHGLLWAAAPGAPDTEPHAPPPQIGQGSRHLLCGPFDVATSAPRVVENFLDTAHFAFVHEGSLGAAGHEEVPGYDVQADAHGRPGVPHYRAWQPQAAAAAAGGAWVDYRYQVLSPYAAVLEKRADGSDRHEAYALWCCPLDEEHTRVWFSLCTSDETTPAADLVAFQAAVFAQDRPLLESQRPRRLPLALQGEGAERHCAADRLSVAYRRWLLALQARPVPGQALLIGGVRGVGVMGVTDAPA